MPMTETNTVTATTNPPISDKDSDKSSDANRRSAGEELYLIHLRREQGRERQEDDFDSETPRKRAHSLGEELWEIHLKRSRGLEPDIDVGADVEQQDLPASTSPPKERDTSKGVSKASSDAEEAKHTNQRCIHLRNRDIPVKGQ